MLTNEQALKIIAQHEECFVVWATDKNEIVAVHPIPNGATDEEWFKALAAMSTDYKGPTRGRFLWSANTTLQTLTDEADEMRRGVQRGAIAVQIYNSWTSRPVDQLIDILVNADFSEPMDVCHDSNHICERLYKIHGPRLSESQIARLEQFVCSAHTHPDQGAAQYALQCYLCVLTNDGARLKHIWQGRHSPKIMLGMWLDFVGAAGDLPTDDMEIIEDIIKIIEKPNMLGPRYEAMVALGKIGQPAGDRAARVITDVINDSSEFVTSARSRAVQLIQSPPHHWSVCPKCYHGYVDQTPCKIPRVCACSNCLGFGKVPVMG